MELIIRTMYDLKFVCALGLLLSSTILSGQNGNDGKKELSHGGEQIRIPNRASAPLFSGKEGKARTEIHFDPATNGVTVKLLVQDANGYFIPNIRPDNFVVYENGVKQQNASVDIERAAVSLGFVMEFGGRSQVLRRVVADEASRAGRQLAEALARDDRMAVWKYSDKVEKLADFSQNRETLTSLFYSLGTPDFSETNLYDALVSTIDQMQPVNGRKAIVLISSGLDTFSKTSYQDVLKTARNSDSPIYAISLAPRLHEYVTLNEPAGPLTRIDWGKADKGLQEIAAASGGRAYSHNDTVDLSPVYDDILENLKLRYVVTYRSSNSADGNTPRTVRVELVDPQTGGPLRIVDESGRAVLAHIVVQDRYTPRAGAGD
jgi:Ca-activated chloride channel family protein